MLNQWLAVAERIAVALERMATAAEAQNERQAKELDWLDESEKRLIAAAGADGFDAKMEAMRGGR